VCMCGFVCVHMCVYVCVRVRVKMVIRNRSYSVYYMFSSAIQ